MTLLYRTQPHNPFFQPYYLFYVGLEEHSSEMQERGSMAEGLHTFGRFYVPAVSGEYLTDFPSWDGSYK